MSEEKNKDTVDVQAGLAMLDRFGAGEIFIPLPELTWIEVTGRDRGAVLGNLTTNHVKALENGQGCETFITEGRGRTYGHANAYAEEDGIVLVSVPGQFERLFAHIDRYVIREEIQLCDRSDDWFAVFWPGISESKFARELELSGNPRPSLAVRRLELSGLQVRAFQTSWTRDTDWLFVVKREEAEALESLLVSRDIVPGHDRLLHDARIMNRTPWFGIDFDENNLPQELDRDLKAIDFKKGCYLGQETIARLDAMGQVQKKMLLWKFSGNQVPQKGTEITSGNKVVATVTSGTYCFAHGAPLALAMTRRSHFAKGSTGASAIGPAEVV
jgi:folate-binding protein YgfZ